MSLIQLKDVYKIYAEGQENQVNALDGVTLSIDQGEFVAIIGTSGSGKSTMMNILGCLDVPTRGEYLLDGTVQLFGDFCENRPSVQLGTVTPHIKGMYQLANVRNIFPEFIAESLTEGIQIFDHKLPGYARCDAVISGVESRTSSPVRLIRDKSLQSEIRGIYPCGEGAGYAGGITSAAMDGIKAAEMIASVYHPFKMES